MIFSVYDEKNINAHNFSKQKKVTVEIIINDNKKKYNKEDFLVCICENSIRSI
jgi:hypothetical protein